MDGLKPLKQLGNASQELFKFKIFKERWLKTVKKWCLRTCEIKIFLGPAQGPQSSRRLQIVLRPKFRLLDIMGKFLKFGEILNACPPTTEGQATLLGIWVPLFAPWLWSVIWVSVFHSRSVVKGLPFSPWACQCFG